MSDLRRRYAFTLVEILVVSILMALVGSLLASTWAGLGRPAVDTMTECRVVQEMQIVAATLARDFGGGQPGDAGRAGLKQQGRLVGWMRPAEGQLWLCFDGGDAPNQTADWTTPDAVVSYELDGDRLVRTDRTNGGSFTVARNIEAFDVTPDGDAVEIRLTFHYRDLVRAYTLVGRTP